MSIEQWKVVEGFSAYEVSEDGRIRSLNYRGWGVVRELVRTRQANGYVKFALTNDDGVVVKKYLHRLVAAAFVENPNAKPEVNHKDGNPSACRADNLEWVTSSENKCHARDTLGAVHGRSPRPVITRNIATGKVVEFVSGNEAARQLSLTLPNMRQVLRGTRPSVGGFTITYKE